MCGGVPFSEEVKMISMELPKEEWINNYPDYVDSKEKYFKFRPFFVLIPEGSVGVEVGTFEGYNALGICRYCNPKKLYVIDPYLVYDSPTDTSIYSQEDWDEIYERAKFKLKDYPVEFIRKSSVESVNDVPDDLDWAYLDANHKKESVTEDIRVWKPKVRKGGLLGGHDIEDPEVKSAVGIFAYNHIRPNPSYTYKWNDWWMHL